MTEFYSDPLITITNDGLVVRRATLLARDKTFRWDEIKKIRAVTPTLWNGRFKFWGTSTGQTWMAMDWSRPARQTIFILHGLGDWSRLGFTVENAPRVKQILKSRGILEDEQGDTLPAPLPQEHRPMLQWAGFWAVVALVGAMVAQAMYYYPHLPQPMATHFNGSGQADGFGDKATFAGIMIGAAAFVAILHVAILHVAISYLVGRTKSAIIGRYTLWIGAATLAFLFVIANLAFRANLTPTRSMGLWPWSASAAFLLTLGAITARMPWKFSRPNAAAA